MKTIKAVTLAIAIAFFMSANTASAQEGNYFTVTTWKMKVPESGSNEELNALLEEFQEKVARKNNKVISEKILRHVSGSDMRDLVIITEYASWNDIDAAQVMQNELVAKAWTDEKERNAWFKSFMKYVVTHSDEIYRENAALRK